ncbi:MAG: IS21-like element helper ATPase IstB [Sediminibacterium sp.]
MNKETVKKMGDMRLYGMQTAFKTFVELPPPVSFTNDEMAEYLVQNEWDDRKHRSLQRNIKTAKFRYVADAEGIDYDHKRELDKNQIDRLFTCEFIKKGQDVFITGSTGTGKSYLASAIGHQACLMGFKVYYANTAKLMSILKLAKADGSQLRELARIEKQDLLILDDFGIQAFDAGGRAQLMDIVEDRHGKHSTIIASQVPVKNWYDVIGEQTVADAILDRLVHQSVRVELKGESLRKNRKEAADEQTDKNIKSK